MIIRRTLISVLLLTAACAILPGSPADSLLQVLDRELERENEYVSAKLDRISGLKTRLGEVEGGLEARALLLDSIFEEYKSFRYDSAFEYISRLQDIAYRLGDPFRIARVKIKMGFIFTSSGMFKEATDSLGTIVPQSLPESTRAEYYSVMAVLNYGLADQQDRYYGPVYEERAHHYVDSVLMLSPGGTYRNLYYKGLRNARKLEFEEGLENLGALRERETLSLHRRAIVNSTMSDICINMGDMERSIELLAEAAVYDIRSAVKETAAILNLANILYQRGKIQRAYTYTKHALEDANFYGARHRKIQVGSILPIIEEEKINTVESQRRLLLIYALVVTVLTIFIIVFIIIIRRQLRKLRRAEHEIRETNRALVNTNQKLLEANRIKEEYIGYYFNLISGYIDKIENIQDSLEKNLANNKFDTVRYIVHNINLERERTNLYEGFDRVFLKLFPGFVDDFNALFGEKDRFHPEDDELLNTDLRIFALIRLGISENDKIARILGFSVNTIYTYKTRIKKKSLVPNEEFENRIMEIRTG